MAASIGSLVAELSANTASFQKDMGKAAAILNSHAAGMNKTVAGIERTISRAGAAFVTAFSAAAIARFGKSVLDMGDQFAKLSQKTGVSVERLSEFAHGARLSDVSMQSLGDSLKKLAVNMAEAATNGTGQMAAAFRALGIQVTDANGNLRDTGQVFEELSARFAGAADGPEKAALAVQLLGKSGSDLIPLMNTLAQTSEEARRLGLVMSTEAARNAEAFNDEMTRLSTKLQMAVLPAITAVSKAVRALMGSDDLDILQAKRARAAAEYSQLIESGMSKNSARIVLLIQQIDELDKKIIESNKRLLGAGGTDKKITLPTVANAGQVKQYEALLQQLQTATQQAQMAITTDEAEAAYQRMAIARDEFIFKAKQLGLWVEDNKKATKQQMEIQSAFADWIRAAEDEARFRSRSQLEIMLDDWKNATKQMRDATANWVDDFADRLTEFVITGKFQFRDFAQSIIRDLVRIAIQKRLAGIVGSILGGGGGGTTGTATAAAAATAARADGGPVTSGRQYLVGERGPELFVPNVSGTIVPNNSSGSVSVTNVFQISAGVAETVRAEIMAAAPVIEERSKQGVLAAIERGGRYSQAVGRKA